jgi:3-hydroxyisobutyrate dehydrogenase
MLAREFTPGFALRLALKDAHLALQAAHEAGLELPLTDALARRWEPAIDEHGDDDIAAVIDAAIAREPAGRYDQDRR